MKKFSRYNKKIRFTYIKCAMLALTLAILFFPSWTKFEKAGDNIFTVWLDGTQVGVVARKEDADLFLARARKQLAKKENGIVLAECDMKLEGQAVLFGKIDEEEHIVDKMAAVLAENERHTLQQAYTVKINEYTVNVASTDEVHQLLQASIDKYDSENKYRFRLCRTQRGSLMYLQQMWNL